MSDQPPELGPSAPLRVTMTSPSQTEASSEAPVEESAQTEPQELAPVAPEDALLPPPPTPPRVERSPNTSLFVDDDDEEEDDDGNDDELEVEEELDSDDEGGSSTAGGAGSRILLNRLSTWRQKANQNATALWRKTNTTTTTTAVGSGSAATAAADAQSPPPAPAAARLTNWKMPLRQASLDPPPPPPPPPPVNGSPPRVSFQPPDDSTAQVETPSSQNHVFSDSSAGGASDYYSDTSSLPDSSFVSTDEGYLRTSLQMAANSVLDSVQAGIYRGRYSNSNSGSRSGSRSGSIPGTPNRQGLPAVWSATSPNATSPAPSQTSRILSSRESFHLQQLMQGLQETEYVMLLGRGMLGVNLKQSFLKQSGTYVDYLVKNGAADRSGVICVGDGMISVGELNVRKETIWTVPEKIALAARPVHLVLCVAAPLPISKIQYIDVCIAIMYRIRQEYEKEQADNDRSLQDKQDLMRGAHSDSAVVDAGDKQAESVSGPSKSNNDSVKQVESNGSNEAEVGERSDPMELVQPTSFDMEDDSLAHIDVVIPIENTVDGFVNPAGPPLAVREAYQPHIAKRNNDGFSLTQLVQATGTNENFRAALRNAFLTCTIDGRRFPFLARHLVQYEEDMNRDETSTGSANATNAMFMLFLEMVNFSDLYGVTPVTRRRDIAKRIAHKFFLPTRTGSELTPPVFDFHHVVADSSLRRLEAALNDTQSELPRDVFFDFQQAVLDSLSGKPFISFLASNECARMRAYLRGTAPFINVSLKEMFDLLLKKPTDAAGKNYFLFLLCYLLCRPEKEDSGEHDVAPGQSGGHRVEDAASEISAAVYIRSVLIPLAEQVREASAPDDAVCSRVIASYERFWETFVAPGVGSIEHASHSNETGETLRIVRADLEEIRSKAATIGASAADHKRLIVDLLVGTKMAADISRLADELLYDYAVNVHSKFRSHKFYEWMCAEIAKEQDDGNGERIIKIPQGSIKRLLRKTDFPSGVSSHKPAHRSLMAPPKPPVKDGCESLVHSNAECAVVFGTSVGLDLAAQVPTPVVAHADLRRYTCQTVGLGDEDSFDAIGPDQIPATLESYAVVPPSRTKPFGNFAEEVYVSSDGWEASIVNFMIPRAEATTDDGEDASLFGVSLVFRRRVVADPSVPVEPVQANRARESDRATSDLDRASDADDVESEIEADSDGSVIQTAGSGVSSDTGVSSATPKRSNVVPSPETKEETSSVINSPIFNERLQERSWTDRISREVRDDDGSVVVGIALVSQRNVIFAMKETLVRLLRGFSQNEEPASGLRECGALVNALGNFAHQDVEPVSLKCILEPFLRTASLPWIERPVAAQREAFEQMAGRQLIRSLSPIPLSLLFVTALLEQKIVLSSSRRSLLLSASVALQELLRPLKWCHLIVPRVPTALAADLLQYPAPFILGMASEDPGIMDLIRELPHDVTLVDLDVGRVILAPSFAHNSEMGRGTPNNESTARELRSQVLYLAQSLGGVFGARMDPQTWLCDQPLSTEPVEAVAKKESEFDTLRCVCQSFLKELLAGTTSCCYWVEEQADDTAASNSIATEPTVLFDEDRFFHIKNQRQRNGFGPLLPTLTPDKESSELALGLDGFDLVLEVFLRCQSMNAFVSSQERDDMIFAL